MKIIFGLIILAILFAVGLTLGSQNDQLVHVNYLLAQGDYRLSSLLAVVFVAGFLIGWLVFGLVMLRLKMTNKGLNKKVERQQKELEELRALPVKD
ncbi:lipopolysaccharide assembly protein LapA domain-containing protein [Oceanimonas pelagia]|uniref:Probable lipopolysaccharide assembly protein A n=1 Tax=Oceanimonas pelagia TaxID=3028314 RepID=A0AA50KKL4_9GAMM|nr:lipopolysaccharide assembly protein LapA domain-containing protein [Oceanimonas pelagia]WMC09253.1 lipopolysaccharide assembly protein LapA domain-containing protein [Oceanimonas pelagia]